MSNTRTWPLVRLNGNYDEDDRAIMDSFADRVMGIPDVELLLGRLRFINDPIRRGRPYQSEAEIIADRGLDSLFDLFMRNGIGENIRALQQELFPNKVGLC